MLKWKDFLYFSKGDKIAIILLSTLICICGIFYIYLNNFTQIDPVYSLQADEVERDFVQFEEEMTVQEPIADEEQTDNTSIKTKKSSKRTVNKLVEGQTLDINSVSQQMLTRIPGIGDTFAERIVEYRNSLGGFASLEQLTEIKGITVNRFSKLLPYLVLKKKHQLIKINRASEKQLSTHPYLNEKQIQEIVDIRQKAKLTSIEDLPRTENFGSRDIDRLSPYLSFE